MGRNQTAEATEKVVKHLTELYAAVDGHDIKVLVMDANNTKGLVVSCVVVCDRLKDRKDSGVAYHTLVIEASHDGFQPRQETINGHTVEIVRPTSIAVDQRLAEKVYARVKQAYPNTNLFNTDTTVIPRTLSLEKADLKDLGQAKRIEIGKENTTIIDGAGDAASIEARVKQIRVQIEEATSDYDREKLQERVAKLAGGVAVIKVGAATEVEMKEKKARVEDALHATRAAVEEGIVPGGGTALIRVSKVLNDIKPADDDELAGVNIIRRSIEEPLRQIAHNAGFEGSIVVEKVRQGKDGFGFNAGAQGVFQVGQHVFNAIQLIGFTHKAVQGDDVFRVFVHGAGKVVKSAFVLALFHKNQADAAQGLVGFFNRGGLLVKNQRLVKLGALHGHSGQAHVRGRALGVAAGSLAAVCRKRLCRYGDVRRVPAGRDEAS